MLPGQPGWFPVVVADACCGQRQPWVQGGIAGRRQAYRYSLIVLTQTKVEPPKALLISVLT